MPDKTNYITLSLSVPALERLMSECPELVVKLSQGVMEEYARRQVKAFGDVALKSIVQKVIAAELGTVTTTGCTQVLKLNSQFEAALKGVVSTQIAALKTELLVEAAARATAVSAELQETIGTKVDHAVNLAVLTYIKTQVAARIKALMDSM